MPLPYRAFIRLLVLGGGEVSHLSTLLWVNVKFPAMSWGSRRLTDALQYRSKGLQHLRAREMGVVCVDTAWTLCGHCLVTAWTLRGHCVDTACKVRVITRV